MKRSFATFGIALFALVACQSPQSSGTTTSSGPQKVVMLFWAPITDTFAAQWCRGLDAASKDWQSHGITAQCQTAVRNYETPAYVDAINGAVAAGYKGIIIGALDPQGIKSALQNAEAKGVTVVDATVGSASIAQELGAVVYVGTDPYQYGQAGGKCLWDAGSRNIIANDFNANGVGEAYLRAKGAVDYVVSHGGKGKIVPINGVGSGPDAVKNAVIGALQSDPTIDGAAGIYSGAYNDSMSGFKASNAIPRVKIAMWDTSVDALNGLKNNEITCMISQQGWLSGYLAVNDIAMKMVYGVDVGGLEGATWTGPFIVSKDNLSQAEQLLQSGRF